MPARSAAISSRASLCEAWRLRAWRKQGAAVGGERHAARLAIEQHHADLVLQASDRLGQRRLADAEPGGGAAHRAGFGHGGEVLDGPQIHASDILRLSVMFRFGLDRVPGLLSRSCRTTTPPPARRRSIRDRAHARAATSESPGRPARRCRDRGARPRLARAGHRRNGRSRTGPCRGDGDPLHEPRYQDRRLDHRLVHREVRHQGRIFPRRLGRRHLEGARRGRCRPAAGRHRRRLGRGRADAHEGARHPQALPLARRPRRARRSARSRRLLGGRPADPGGHPVQHAGGRREPARRPGRI